jgi:hypothetical protein
MLCILKKLSHSVSTCNLRNCGSCLDECRADSEHTHEAKLQCDAKQTPWERFKSALFVTFWALAKSKIESFAFSNLRKPDRKRSFIIAQHLHLFRINQTQRNTLFSSASGTSTAVCVIFI